MKFISTYCIKILNISILSVILFIQILSCNNKSQNSTTEYLVDSSAKNLQEIYANSSKYEFSDSEKILIKSKICVTENKAAKINFKNDIYDTYTVNLKTSDICFFFKNSNNKRFSSIGELYYNLRKTEEYLEFSTNGGMFSESFEPMGLYVENGSELFPINLGKGTGNFFLQPNGIFLINKNKTASIIPSSKFSLLKKNILYASQSGPILLLNGKIPSNFSEKSKNTYIRSGVGIINSQQVVFAISEEPVTFYNFALMFKDCFKCNQAIYLDGAISKMFIPKLDRFDLEGDFAVLIGIIKK